MALILADRVQETTTTAGTGTISLDGATAGYKAFVVGVGSGNTTYYTILDGTSWEVGVGTVTAGSPDTLSRDTVLSNSLGTTAQITLSGGTCMVWADYPAGTAVTTDTLATPPTIGGTTPAAATFTTLTATGQTVLGGATGSEAFRAVTTASAVNRLQAAGATTGTAPILSAAGTDTNIPLAFVAKGTGPVTLATGSKGVVVSNGGTVTAITRTAAGSGYTTAPTVTIAPPTTPGGVQATATCTITAGAVDATFTITNAGSGYLEQPAVTFSGGGGSGAAAYATIGGIASVRGLGSALSVYAPGGEQFRVADTYGGGAATNYFAVYGRSGNSPVFSVAGTDANIGVVYTTKGTASHTFWSGNFGGQQFSVAHTASAVNYQQITGAATTYTPIHSVQGPDTNIALALQSKGTGGIDLAAGPSGVNISNGGSVTTITRTAAGSGYTTAPTMTIAPPTTPGGVQATATCTITAGAVDSTFIITNAGSGYLEQPAVTFSGGGGSGAAAYASVGSATAIKSLGGSIYFSTPSGINFAIFDGGANSVTYPYATGGSASAGYGVTSANADAGFTFASKGIGALSFYTNNYAALQFRVAHTASAVNYVQVTGAATGSSPTLSAQGSDTNIDLILTPKGTGVIKFGTYTTLGSEVLAGYITIKDSGGTVRKLAVIA